jgi:2'-hydroxyisoflavone reductase
MARCSSRGSLHGNGGLYLLEVVDGRWTVVRLPPGSAITSANKASGSVVRTVNLPPVPFAPAPDPQPTMPDRRQFLGSAAALFAGAAVAPLANLPRRRATLAPAAASLSILVLGGTGFIGPHVIERALARGHRVTMFNRGSNPGLFGDEVEELTGDRDPQVGTGLTSLEGDRRWDVVIDNSGYVPRHVRATAELLEDRVGRYLYTSTVAVYDDDAEPPIAGVHIADRDSPLLPAPDPPTEEVTGATYGPLKAEGDRIVRALYGERATVVRPCYIVGPGDTTDRFTYWVERLHRGGEVVCPAHPGYQINWIDVRDLCALLIHLAEAGTPGAFNGVGPASPLTNEEALWGLRAFAAAPTSLYWPEATLLEELEFPTPMFDASRPDQRNDATAAVAAGLSYRSLAETVRDTHAWWLEQSDERRASPRGWPSAEAEAAVLARIRG